MRLRIREHREARGWTLADLGRRAGVQKSNLSEWERGKELPTLRTLLRLARALGVKVADLLDE